MNSPRWWGRTPLHYAAVNYNGEAVRLLLERGALTRNKDWRGQTASDKTSYTIADIIRTWEESHPEVARALDPKMLAAKSRVETIRNLEDDGYVIVLIPFGEIDMGLLTDLRRQLHVILGIPVFVETGNVSLPSVEDAARHKRNRIQWNADKLLYALGRRIGHLGRANIGCLGVTSDDIYAQHCNYLFGLSSTGVSVMSYARFVSRDRDLLLERMRKQALSSIGLMFNLPRCKNKECPRSYADRLAEQDAKSADLCTECRQAFADLFGVEGQRLREESEPLKLPDDDIF